MQLGYNFSEKVFENSNFDSLRIYVSVDNPFTFTNYQGYDPTATSGAPIGAGIDIGFYPTPRIYRLGLNLKF